MFVFDTAPFPGYLRLVDARDPARPVQVAAEPRWWTDAAKDFRDAFAPPS
jgi:hypothetical protein